MNTIDFLLPFDKLHNNTWTTIRKYNIQNRKKYSRPGETFIISIKGIPAHIATLKSVEEKHGADIDNSVISMDVMVNGKINQEWFSKIKSMPECLLLTFEKNIIYHNPLDNILEKYSGIEVSSSTFMDLFDYDAEKSEEYLYNWVFRHENDCFILEKNPLRIKVTLTPHDIKAYNENMRSKNRRWH